MATPFQSGSASKWPFAAGAAITLLLTPVTVQKIATQCCATLRESYPCPLSPEAFVGWPCHLNLAQQLLYSYSNGPAVSWQLLIGTAWLESWAAAQIVFLLAAMVLAFVLPTNAANWTTAVATQVEPLFPLAWSLVMAWIWRHYSILPIYFTAYFTHCGGYAVWVSLVRPPPQLEPALRRRVLLWGQLIHLALVVVACIVMPLLDPTVPKISTIKQVFICAVCFLVAHEIQRFKANLDEGRLLHSVGAHGKAAAAGADKAEDNPSTHQVLAADGAGPSPQHLLDLNEVTGNETQASLAVQRMPHRYHSQRLPKRVQTVVIKVPYAHPKQLPSTIYDSLRDELSTGGITLLHAHARFGCLELALTLMTPAAEHQERAGGSHGSAGVPALGPMEELTGYVMAALHLPAPPEGGGEDVIHVLHRGRLYALEYSRQEEAWRVVPATVTQPPVVSALHPRILRAGALAPPAGTVTTLMVRGMSAPLARECVIVNGAAGALAADVRPAQAMSGSATAVSAAQVVLPADSLTAAGLVLVAVRNGVSSIVGEPRPLLVVDSEAVAQELETAVADWAFGEPSELDQLLMDLGGFWDGIAAVHDAAPPTPGHSNQRLALAPPLTLPATAAPEPPPERHERCVPDMAQLIKFGSHLLEFAVGCGWRATARRLLSDLMSLGASFSAVAGPCLLEAAQASGSELMEEQVLRWLDLYKGAGARGEMEGKAEAGRDGGSGEDEGDAGAEGRLSPPRTPPLGSEDALAEQELEPVPPPQLLRFRGGALAPSTGDQQQQSAEVVADGLGAARRPVPWAGSRAGFAGRQGWLLMRRMLGARHMDRLAFARFLAAHNETRMVMMHVLTICAGLTAVLRVGAMGLIPGRDAAPPAVLTPAASLQAQPCRGDMMVLGGNCVVQTALLAMWVGSRQAYRELAVPVAVACRLGIVFGKVLAVLGLVPQPTWVLHLHQYWLDLPWEVCMVAFCCMAPLLPWLLATMAAEVPVNAAFYALHGAMAVAGWALHRALVVMALHVVATLVAQAYLWGVFEGHQRAQAQELHRGKLAAHGD